MMKLTYVLFAIALALPTSAMAGGGKRQTLFLMFGDDVELQGGGGKGDVILHAQCVQAEGGTEDVVRIYATTTGAKTVLNGDDNYDGNGDYLAPGTAPVDAELQRLTAPTGTERVASDGGEGFVLSLETGQGFAVNDSDSGTLMVNPSGIYDPADCIISVGVTRLSISAPKLKAPKP